MKLGCFERFCSNGPDIAIPSNVFLLKIVKKSVFCIKMGRLTDRKEVKEKERERERRKIMFPVFEKG